MPNNKIQSLTVNGVTYDIVDNTSGYITANEIPSNVFVITIDDVEIATDQWEWQADKTVSEIKSAYDAGKQIILQKSSDDIIYNLIELHSSGSVIFLSPNYQEIVIFTTDDKIYVFCPIFELAILNGNTPETITDYNHTWEELWLAYRALGCLYIGNSYAFIVANCFLDWEYYVGGDISYISYDGRLIKLHGFSNTTDGSDNITFNVEIFSTDQLKLRSPVLMAYVSISPGYDASNVIFYKDVWCSEPYTYLETTRSSELEEGEYFRLALIGFADGDGNAEYHYYGLSQGNWYWCLTQLDGFSTFTTYHYGWEGNATFEYDAMGNAISYNDLTNKPTIPTVPTNVSSFTNDAGYLTSSDIASVLKYKGTKASYSALPSSGNVTGDVWHLTDTGAEWAWDGSAWQELGTAIDLSNYAIKATTLSGYGITDAKIQNGTITLGSNTITPLTSYTETDPTVPSWAKQSSKPSYTASEVGAMSTSHVANGITASDISNWNGKSDTDEKVKQTPLNDTNSTNYRLVVSYGTNGIEQTNIVHTTDKIYINNSTPSIIVGKASDTQRLSVRSDRISFIYNSGNYQGHLKSSNITTTDKTWTLPDASGTIALTSDIPDASSFLTSESDPVFSASAAAGITATDISNWNAKSDTDIKLQIGAVTSGTEYYPIVGTGTTAAIRQYDADGFKYKSIKGTTSTTGSATLSLGNSTASGTVNNEQGKLVLYGTNSRFATITLADPTSNIDLALPTKQGTLAIGAISTDVCASSIDYDSSGFLELKSISNENNDINTVTIDPSGINVDLYFNDNYDYINYAFNNYGFYISKPYDERTLFAFSIDDNTLFIDTDSFKYLYSSGWANNSNGYSRLVLGNNIASSTTGWTKGEIQLYGTTTYYTSIISGAPTANRTITLPDKTGTVALTSDIPSVYSSTNTGGYLTMATLPTYDGTVV